MVCHINWFVKGRQTKCSFSRLLSASGKNIEVACPKHDGGMGNRAIHKRLIGLQSKFNNISRVVVVVDSDDDPERAFNDACEEFNKANVANPAKSYPIPITLNTIAALAGSPETAISTCPR